MQTQTSQRAQYEAQGYLVVRSLFAADEAQALGEAFSAMHARGGVPGRYQPPALDKDYNDGFHHPFKGGDPLLRYPRVMWPHAYMPEARQAVLKPAIFDLLAELLGEEVLSVSSMFYFKPPQARGQAFHQDNFYLRVKPGTCIAVWVACDPADAGNGGLQVIPGTHRMDIVCPETSDPGTSFAKEFVKPPLDIAPELPELKPGDALVFHGALIHGSQPNPSAKRFRRSLVCHYMPVSAVEVSKYDDPLMDRQGRAMTRAEALGGGPCGTPHDTIAP